GERRDEADGGLERRARVGRRLGEGAGGVEHGDGGAAVVAAAVPGTDVVGQEVRAAGVEGGVVGAGRAGGPLCEVFHLLAALGVEEGGDPLALEPNDGAVD